MTFSALIPFAILFIGFVGLKLPLTYSSFFALLSGTVITQTLFQANESIWMLALSKTLVMMVEIGVIILGAFFFLEVARKAGIIDSLAKLVRAVSPNRVIQGVLVTFPLELMVEGSSGFGTPLLVIAPILFALHFEIELCALLPLLSCVVGVPFGALGTPTRLGFPDANPTVGTFLALSPLLFIAPLLSAYLISKKFALKESIWVISMSTFYFLIGRMVSFHGPDLSALGPAFFTFIFGLITARIFFGSPEKVKFELKGIVLYGFLLFSMWLGKSIWMEEHIPGSQIRIFNPGYIFILFALGLMFMMKGHSRMLIFSDTFQRARKTLTVFFCMTFLVQQLRANGSLDLLTHAIPHTLLGSGTPILGWMGSAFVGTSTMSNLLMSKVVDPIRFVPLAAGSAIGVQLAFQSVVAMKSILHDRISEKEIFFRMAPFSVFFILVVSFTTWLFNVF